MEKGKLTIKGLPPQDWLDAIGIPAVLVESGVATIANTAALDILDEPLGKGPSGWNVVFDKPISDVDFTTAFESKAAISGNTFNVHMSPLGGSRALQLWTFRPIQESERERKLKKAVEIRTRLLKAAEDKYRLLFKESSFGIVQLDPNGDWITANPTFLDIVGRSEGELPELKFADLIYSGDKRDFIETQQAWLSGEKKRSHHCRIVRPDSSTRHVLIWAQRMESAGALAGIQLSMVDVTTETEKRLAAEAEKDRIRESLENIVGSMLEALVVVEPDGRIASVNKAMLDLLGWEEEKLVGKPVGVLFAGEAENIAEETRNFARLLKASAAREVEMVWRRYDGSLVPVSFNASIMRDSHGKLVGIVGVARDESENRLRRKVEETNKQLERALKELKAVNAAKDDLVSMVGHELRGPLAGIRGFAEFLAEPKITRKERMEFSRKILTEIDRLTRMVNDILDLAKMEAGKLRYFMEPASINDVISDCIERAGPVAKARNVTFKTSFEECPPLVFDVDRMKQAIDNLLSNAIKFSADSGEIELATSDHKHFVKVAVKDHGVGIPEEQKDAVFDKFEQTPDGRRRRGTGLGMPITRAIIEDGHRGRLWFESVGEGKGTTFYLTIPKNIKPTAR